jgi:hypothetical protein
MLSTVGAIAPHECSVMPATAYQKLAPDSNWQSAPPMLEAAIPVLAVTETISGFFACFFLSAAMIAFKSNDFPVPTGSVSRHRQCGPLGVTKKKVGKEGGRLRCTCGASKKDVLSLVNDHPQYPHLFIAQHYIKDLLLRIPYHTVESGPDSYGNLWGEESVDCQLWLLHATRVENGVLRLALDALFCCGLGHGEIKRASINVVHFGQRDWLASDHVTTLFD